MIARKFIIVLVKKTMNILVQDINLPMIALMFLEKPII
nr:MAG TPA: hypothetical protein [Caudoviricetes sp.]